MSIIKSALLAVSLAVAAASSANAYLVVNTPDAPYEYGGLQEPAGATHRSTFDNSAWPNTFNPNAASRN
jgi:hypothetical protein